MARQRRAPEGQLSSVSDVALADADPLADAEALAEADPLAEPPSEANALAAAQPPGYAPPSSRFCDSANAVSGRES